MFGWCWKGLTRVLREVHGGDAARVFHCNEKKLKLANEEQ